MNRKCWHGFGDDKNKPDGQTLSSSLLLLLLFPSNGLPYPRRLLVARSYYLREWIGAEFFRSTGHFYLFDYRFRPLGLFFFFFFLEPILYDATWVTDPSLLLLLLYSTNLIQFFPPPNPPISFCAWNAVWLTGFYFLFSSIRGLWLKSCVLDTWKERERVLAFWAERLEEKERVLALLLIFSPGPAAAQIFFFPPSTPLLWLCRSPSICVLGTIWKSSFACLSGGSKS